MAKNFTMSVDENFDVEELANNLAESYQGKGYTARVIKMKNSTRVTIEKGNGGLNKITGLGEGITVNLIKQKNEVLAVSFCDEEWTSKIVGGAIGLFVCWILCGTAIVGALRQSSLSKNIENDIYMLVNEA